MLDHQRACRAGQVLLAYQIHSGGGPLSEWWFNPPFPSGSVVTDMMRARDEAELADVFAAVSNGQYNYYYKGWYTGFYPFIWGTPLSVESKARFFGRAHQAQPADWPRLAEAGLWGCPGPGSAMHCGC